VLRRLEVRAILEPGIAALAAGRRAKRDLEAMQEAIDDEMRARDGLEAHDASRRFHVALARASGNDEFVRVIESLWLVEVGRRLLFRRSTEPDWQREDVSEHREVLAAISEGHAAEAERLMAGHVRGAVHHWEPELGDDEGPAEG
jgi:DNA-binding FadR family transcriptional regulator